MKEPHQLVPADLKEGALTREEDYADMTTTTAYLPRFQLCAANSNACIDGKIGIGRYGLVKDDEITDLGEEVDVLVINWRSKAVDVGGDAPINVFDPKSDLFIDIKARSGVKDSGCMYGPEFLIWIPSVSSFALYHMNSKTARREAKKMPPFIGCAATLRIKLIDPPGVKYKWHGPVLGPCSAPMDAPPEDELRKQYAIFNDPPAPELEPVDEGEGRER